MRKEIDINTWDRKEHFEFYSDIATPHYCVAFNVDITKLLEFTRENKISFYYSLIYLCTQSIKHADYLQVDFDGDNNIVRQPWVEDESAVTIVFMPYEIEDMENGENRIIRFTNNYWVDNTEYIEEYRVTFSVQNGQLVIVDEYWELDEK